jgi:DNA-binding transcriptional MerR regulator
VVSTPNLSSDGFSGKRTADIVGISYRQLDYWARTDLIRPSLADARGSGTRRRYSYRDLLELKLVKTLLDNGIKLESIRDAFTYLRDQLGEPDIASAKLVITGNTAVLVRENDELIDIVNRGQGVLNLLPLDGVKEQVDTAIVELFPERAAEGEAEADTAGAAPADGEGDEPPAAFRRTGSS